MENEISNEAKYALIKSRLRILSENYKIRNEPANVKLADEAYCTDCREPVVEEADNPWIKLKFSLEQSNNKWKRLINTNIAE